MIKVYTDAAFQPQYFCGGIGVIIENSSRTFLKFHRSYVENNHILEFEAVYLALKYLEDRQVTKDILTLYSDSKIVIDSIEKQYCKDEKYRIFLEKILIYLEGYPLYFVNWVPDTENKGADQLARQALRQEGNYFTLDQN